MSNGNPIPTQQRTKTRKRDGGYCVRCFCPANPGQMHHRRGKRVNDEHQHCTCNMILMCPECHAYVHRQPADARKHGWIVSRHDMPFGQPIWWLGSWQYLTCDATTRSAA